MKIIFARQVVSSLHIAGGYLLSIVCALVTGGVEHEVTGGDLLLRGNRKSSVMELTITGRSETMYHIEYSTNLVQWSALMDYPGFSDQTVVSAPARGDSMVFYRGRTGDAVNDLCITEQPVAMNLQEGQPFGLQVGVTGTGPMDYQWWLNGQPIPGETSPTCVWCSANAFNTGQYGVVIRGAHGAVVSRLVDVVILNPPVLQDRTVDEDGAVTLCGQVASTGSFAYQWYKDDVQLPGQICACLTIVHAQPSDAGLYKVRVKNQAGYVTSNAARLTVTAGLAPSSLAGKTLRFTSDFWSTGGSSQYTCVFSYIGNTFSEPSLNPLIPSPQYAYSLRRVDSKTLEITYEVNRPFTTTMTLNYLTATSGTYLCEDFSRNLRETGRFEYR